MPVITNQLAPAFNIRIQLYQNEDTLGAAIKASGKPRESFFVTTKLSSLESGETVSDGLRKSLSRLGLGAFRPVSQNIKPVDTSHQIASTSI